MHYQSDVFADRARIFDFPFEIVSPCQECFFQPQETSPGVRICVNLTRWIWKTYYKLKH